MQIASISFKTFLLNLDYNTNKLSELIFDFIYKVDDLKGYNKVEFNK